MGCSDIFLIKSKSFCVRIAVIYKFSGGAYMKERILIMEDETAIQSVLYELLTDAGYGAY